MQPKYSIGRWFPSPSPSPSNAYRTCTQRQKGQKGFTLIEVMVAVGILGILAAMAAPNFRGIIERWQVKSTTESLIASIYLARTEAMKRGGGVEFSKISGLDDCPASKVSGQWECGWRIQIPDPADSTQRITVQEVERQRNVTVTLNVSNASKNSMIYDRQGRASDLGLGTFRFTIQTQGSSGAVASLCMSQAGRLREVKAATCS